MKNFPQTEVYLQKHLRNRTLQVSTHNIYLRQNNNKKANLNTDTYIYF